MTNQGGQRLEVLTSRTDVLRRLCDGPVYKRDLVEDMGLSRSTINRAISELEAAGFAESTPSGITATLAGRLAVDRLTSFQSELEDLAAAEAVVDPLPVDVPVTTDVVVGADAVLASDPTPYEPLERAHDELKEANSYRVLLPVLDDPRHVRLLYEHVITGGNTADLVVTPSVFETLCEEFPRRMTAMTESDEFRVSVTDDLPPFTLGCFDDGADRTVTVVVFTDSGTVHGALINETNGAGVWAADRFETAARAATDRTDELVADPDGGTVTDSPERGLATRGQSLSVPLEREGFVRLDTTYFGNEPVADPETAWRAGLSLVEVHTGYAVERTHDADDVGVDETDPDESVTDRLTSALTEGTDCVVVGPPGAGKSTLCKRVACAWYETDRGPVLYRERGRGRPFQSVEDLVRTVEATDGHALVVVEDAVRAEANAVFAALDRLADRDDVSFLLDSRESEWLNPPRQLEVPDLRVTTIPRLAETDCERLVEQFERTVGAEVDVPTDRLWESVRAEIRAENASVGGMLLLLHRLSTYTDPLADEQTTLETEVATLAAEFADDDLALSVCVLANTLNAAGLGVDRGTLYAVADPDEFEAVDDALASLEGRMLFERPDGSYRTVHDSWSVTFLTQLSRVLGDESARQLFGGTVTSLFTLADSPDKRERIRTHLGDSPVVEGIETRPAEWVADAVESVATLGEKRPKLAPLFGDGATYSIDLPAVCPAATREEWPVWLGRLFLAGGYYDRAERAFERLDPAAIERLLGLAQVATETGAYDEAIGLADQCLNQADRRCARARAHLLAGRALTNSGEYEAARDHFQAALDRFETVDDRRRVATVLDQLGRAAREQGNYEAAREFLQQSLDISRTLGDRAGEASSLTAIGAAVFGLGEYDQAREYFEWGLDIARERGDRRREFTTLKWIGTVAMYVSEYDRAREYTEQALEVARELGDPRKEAEILGTRGLLAERVGEYDEARTVLQQGLDLAADIGNSRCVAARYNNLGLVEIRLGEHDTAHDHFTAGLDVAREHGHRRHEANSLNGLGHVATMRGRYEQARTQHEAALAITREIENRRRIADSYNKLGRVAYRLAEYDRARDRFEDARELARELNHPREAAKSLVGLGELARIDGQYDQAHEHVEAAREYIDGTGAGIGTTHVRLSNARLALDRGDDERARDLGETVRDEYAAVDAAQWLGRSERLLGRIAVERDDEEAAREHWEASLEALEALDAPQDELATLELLVEHADDPQRWHERVEDCAADAPDVVVEQHREWLDEHLE